ncbi:hypothetical protein [Paraburkholderia sp. J8-2]|uniref:hypothetical protein n=1 Tax=Paraburkholderia sp. J8-2 TaxID=2805440 RepID=UPI002AB70EF3|nr:hypothetical protein [Paraburkholderia sp. J8-2]
MNRNVQNHGELPAKQVAPVVARLRADSDFNVANARMRQLIEQQPHAVKTAFLEAYSVVLEAAEGVRDQYQSDWRAAKSNNNPKTDRKTIYCIAREGDVGGVSWFATPEHRSSAQRFAGDVDFDLDVPSGATRDEVSALADRAAWEKWYEGGNPVCRRPAGKAPHTPNACDDEPSITRLPQNVIALHTRDADLTFVIRRDWSEYESLTFDASAAKGSAEQLLQRARREMARARYAEIAAALCKPSVAEVKADDAGSAAHASK